ncbi:hypothetical protein BASA81_016645 [Batrachochytrium salamandrivorans]|nr:hypothetical protein BASA81_016645 [Batrachochytrium salamandrivorans]
MDALRNTIALQQKATANLEKILSNMASQAASTSEATQAALAAILARLEVEPVVPQVVVVQLLVDADYVSAFTRIITSLDATIVKSFKAWIPRPEAADKDKLAAISSFATLEAATAEAAKIRVQTPGFDISTLETVPKESLPVKKATDKEPAAPAVDPPSDMAAEVTPAIQDDGVTPTVTPIADVEMCL